MKKLLLIYRVITDTPHGSIGVVQKMYDQKSAFEALGFEVDLIYLKKDGIYLNDRLIHSIWLKRKILIYRFFHTRFYKLVYNLISHNTYDLCYIRFHLLHVQFIHFIKKLKEQLTQKLIIEIPTFPYEGEYRDMLARMRIREDRRLRKQLRKHIDAIVSYSPDEEIFGISVIQIQNGVNTNRIGLRKQRQVAQELRMIAVGKLWDWYGLDRLIDGISAYEKKKNSDISIHLHIVGEGPEKKNLRARVRSLGIEHLVVFHEGQSGDPLDRLFDAADIAVGTLAIHRKHVKYSSSIKHRDYAARGIPFFYSGSDRGFDQELPWILTIKEGDTPVDIDAIMDLWSRRIDPKIIRQYAIKYLRWEQQLQKIIRFLEIEH